MRHCIQIHAHANHMNQLSSTWWDILLLLSTFSRSYVRCHLTIVVSINCHLDTLFKWTVIILNIAQQSPCYNLLCIRLFSTVYVFYFCDWGTYQKYRYTIETLFWKTYSRYNCKGIRVLNSYNCNLDRGVILAWMGSEISLEHHKSIKR
jgi:hypothetical protein